MPAGGNSRFRGYPARMSERQQLALLMQMTSQEMVSGGTRADVSNGTRSSTTPSRGSKGRWANKNGDQSPVHRKDDYRAQKMTGNTCEQNTKDNNEATGSKSGESTVVAAAAAGSDNPRSPAETGAAGVSPNNSHHQVRAQSQSPQHFQHHNNYQLRPGGSSATPTAAEESGALCEMRRTPPQNKVDRSATGQTGGSPRLTLRLNQVRGTRDEKKNINSRQSSINTSNSSQMDNSKTAASSTTSLTSTATTTSTNNTSTMTTTTSGSAAMADTSDIYEFKSSKEATPVRGSSSSPNPTGDKEKEGIKVAGQNPVLNSTVTTCSTVTTSSETLSTAVASSTSETQATCSPSAKRAFESDNTDDLDEENRRKKRKESESSKDSSKSSLTGRQNAGRAAGNVGEKCSKTGKQISGSTASKPSQDRGSSAPSPSNTAPSAVAPSTGASGAANLDRKSPTSAASSPKPSTGATAVSKNSTPAPCDSDGDEDRPKSSDSSSAPKVPPLKIVIPQSTTSEQEQGVRNGKNTSTRGHQLPYVVPSSNSNDSNDKDQSQSASGTASPTDASANTKTEEKKDFTGVIHSEERSTHHQRVLRSSHRTSNGGNGSTLSKDSTQSSNVTYSNTNSSPLPSAPTTDRSNNSSPQHQQQQLQQQQTSPLPDSVNSESTKTPINSESSGTTKPSTAGDKSEKNTAEISGKNQKESSENSESSSSSTSVTTSSVTTTAPTIEPPRKRKIKPSKEIVASTNESSEATNTGPEIHPHDQPITNCYQLFLNIRKQIERRRKGLFPVQPKPPQGFKDYLMNRCTYVLAGNANKEPNVNPPVSLQVQMKELYVEQEKERYRLRMQHVVEKEKLVLSVEQEILRVHGRAARALANQSLPFSVCTILKDEEVYNVITPEQEEKDRNARSRYNGRLFLSWLQDVDDKWEKIKEAMLLRHHNEAESLHAVQRMDWEWKLKEVGLCEFKATPQIEDIHVPMVHVSDDFDLLPA